MPQSRVMVNVAALALTHHKSRGRPREHSVAVEVEELSLPKRLLRYGYEAAVDRRRTVETYQNAGVIDSIDYGRTNAIGIVD